MKIPAKASISSRSSTITSQFARAKAPYLRPSAEDLSRRYEHFGMTAAKTSCYYCDGDQSEWDHLEAVIKNGEWTGYFTEINNLIPACGKCNQSRGNKPYDEWMMSNAPASPKNVLMNRDKLTEADAVIKVKQKIKLIDSVIKSNPPKHLSVDNQSILEIEYEKKRVEIIKLLNDAQKIANQIQSNYQTRTNEALDALRVSSK